MRKPSGITSARPGTGSDGTFDPAFRSRFEDLLRWRRDVRRFRSDPLETGVLDELLDLARLAPSVGFSQPWRFVTVADPARRAAVTETFKRCNAEALSDYAGERARLYAGLKLAGLTEAPVHLAVFCDDATDQGAGLGRRTMPETLRYSVVAAVQTFWLAARARDVGVGWVSILDPEDIKQILEVPEDWTLIAYLCVGYPEEQHLDPELERHGWEARQAPESQVLKR